MIIVGNYVGTEALSAVSIVNQFVFIFNLLIFGASAAAGIFTAQYHGSGDREGVRALAPEIRRRLEGAHAGLEHEVFGVEHDAREQRVSLNVAERLIVEVADDLAAHLARG